MMSYNSKASLPNKCRFGKICWKLDCILNHPSSRRLCSKGGRCDNLNCSEGNHPPECTQKQCDPSICEFRHTCSLDQLCWDERCTKAHSGTLFRCKWGKNCHKNRCIKVHPPACPWESSVTGCTDGCCIFMHNTSSTHRPLPQNNGKRQGKDDQLSNSKPTKHISTKHESAHHGSHWNAKIPAAPLSRADPLLEDSATDCGQMGRRDTRKTKALRRSFLRTDDGSISSETDTDLGHFLPSGIVFRRIGHPKHGANQIHNNNEWKRAPPPAAAASGDDDDAMPPPQAQRSKPPPPQMESNVVLDSSGREIVNILVIGETGAGKSSFINLLANYFKDGSLDKLEIAIPCELHRIPTIQGFTHSESNICAQGQSQTSAVTDYGFIKGGCSFTIIDTPGLSDTSGADQDDKNIELIVDRCTNLESLSAVVLVIKGTNARITMTTRNCMMRLKGFLPDDLLANMFVVFTCCATKQLQTFPISALPFPVDPKNLFHMDNSSFSLPPKHLLDVDTLTLSEINWKLSIKQVNSLLTRIFAIADSATHSFITIKKSRDEVKVALHSIRLELQKMQLVYDKLEEAEAALANGTKDVKQFCNYTKITTVTTTKLVDAPYHSTICSSCNTICHDGCGLEELAVMGDNRFRQCMAFQGRENCYNCPHRCSYTVHHHGKKTVEQVEETIESILDDVKQMHDKAQANLSQAQKGKMTHSQAKKLIDDHISSMISQLKISCQDIKRLCKGYNLVAELDVLLTQIRVEKRLITNTQALEAAKQFEQAIEGIINGLNAVPGSGNARYFARYAQPFSAFPTAAVPSPSSSSAPLRRSWFVPK